MSFVGRLEHFPLTDLLQFLAGSQKTGTLTLTLRFDQGLLVLREGRIIYAASTSSRQTLGSVLVSRGLIREEHLAQALEKMLDASREQRLGNILVESGIIDSDTLLIVLRDQVRSVMAEFMNWKDAYFRFEPLQIPDHGEVEVDAKDFLLEQGLAAEQVLFDLMNTEVDSLDETVDLLDEERREEDCPVASLWTIMSEIQPPEFTGEITLRILDEARKHLGRGALFGVYHDGFRRMNQFDTNELNGAVDLHDTSISIEAPSLLGRVLDSRRTYRGPLPDQQVDKEMLSWLGGGEPREVLAIPMIVNGRVVAILFGDDGPFGGRLASIEPLELQLAELSLSMERATLEKRLRHLDRLRRKRESK